MISVLFSLFTILLLTYIYNIYNLIKSRTKKHITTITKKRQGMIFDLNLLALYTYAVKIESK